MEKGDSLEEICNIFACINCEKVKDNESNTWYKPTDFKSIERSDRLIHSVCPGCLQTYAPNTYQLYKHLL